MTLYRCTRCGTWLAPWVFTPCLLCRVRLWTWLRFTSAGRSASVSPKGGDRT